MTTRYQPVNDGYRIIGSDEVFNRTLYGGHEQDDLPERFFTYAGDSPMVMGAVTDWRKRADCTHAKCGTLLAGVAQTPGVKIPIFYYAGETDGDRYSQWFHESPGTVSTFRNGWMEYEVKPFFQCGPSVTAAIQVLPLMPEAGFLYHVRLTSDQHVNLVLGFGGVTDFLGALANRVTQSRYFSPENCRANRIILGKNRALVEGPAGTMADTRMWIGTSFDAEMTLGDAKTVKDGPGKFSDPNADSVDTPMVRMRCEIDANRAFEGFMVVVRNADESVLDRWLAKRDPVGALKQAIRQKHAGIVVETPDPMLNLTVPPSVIALDACWHRDTFYHGAASWHSPYMGWRNWYGPTVIGWHDRIRQATLAHAATQVTNADGPEEVDARCDMMSGLKNSVGFIPEIPDGRKHIFYNMQEVYVDHVLHHLEWTNEVDLARQVFPVIARVLEWEERILDPDGDGLYQNWLNTWISDAHSYNGGGCAQASAYNYRANRTMAGLAKILGLDPEPFARRAEKIRRACGERLWLADKGVLAEYVDTIGNKLVHPSPELATAYHAVESGLVDPFQAYQILRFTETNLRNERTTPRGGRLVWSSNWYPQNYSSCGLYTAENIHLAWAYLRCGLVEKGHEILTAIVDAHFMSDNPGATSHCMTGSGYTSGASDFTETMSLHLRLIVEGLFGVHFNLPEGQIEVAPNFPLNWSRAKLSVKDVSVAYERKGRVEMLSIADGAPANRVIRLPMRGTSVQSVELNGRDVQYRIESGIGRAYVVVETRESGTLVLRVAHGAGRIPKLKTPVSVTTGRKLHVAVTGGSITECKDPSACCRDVEASETSFIAVTGSDIGWHTVFVKVKQDAWEAWLPADFEIAPKPGKLVRRKMAGEFVPVDISSIFNIALADIHSQTYCRPRPAGYSIMARANGRFGWDWNQTAHGQVVVDDRALRTCGGTYITPSGVPFRVPAEGPNVACASMWENFPEQLVLPLRGRGSELAVFLIGVTNPMQSRVENVRLTVDYADGKSETVSLVHPTNFDDWLVGSVQSENETVYFSDRNHGLVQRISLDSESSLKSLTIRAVANEVIVGILGVSVRQVT